MKFNTSIRCFTAFFQPPAYAFKGLINILRQRSISQEMEIAAKTVKMHTLLFQREFFSQRVQGVKFIIMWKSLKVN